MHTHPKRALFALLIPAAVVSTTALAIELTIVDGSVTPPDGTEEARNDLADLGDVNGDGYNDLGVLFGNDSDTTTHGACVYYGGADVLSDNDADCFYVTNAHSIFAIGDHDGDGYDDVAVQNAEGGSDYTYLFGGSSSGVDTNYAVKFRSYDFVAGKLNHAVPADVNGDGYDDIVAFGLGRMGVAWGPHSSADERDLDTPPTKIKNSAASHANHAKRIGAADFDGDGYDDVLAYENTGSYGKGVAGIHYGSATGVETTPSTTITNPSISNGSYHDDSAFWTGDFDCNGWPDALMSDTNNNFSVAYNDAGIMDASGTASGITSVSYAYDAFVYVADTDSDGCTDLVITEPDSERFTVYPGSSSGLSSTGTEYKQATLSGYGSHVLAQDYDGDGVHEVMVRQGPNVVWSVGAAAVTDTDGDGIDDVDDLCPNDAADADNDDDLNGCADVAADGTSTVTFDGETDGQVLTYGDTFFENGVEYWQVHNDTDASFIDLGDGDVGVEDSVLNSSGTPVAYQFADGSPIILEGLEGFNRATASSGAITVSCYDDTGARTVNQVAVSHGSNETEPSTLSVPTQMDGVECAYLTVDQLYFSSNKDGVVTGLTFSKGSGSTDGDGVCDTTDALDSDGDLVMDDCDAFPTDATESVDTDGDGTGDNSDAFPVDATEDSDADADGVGDNSDLCVTEDATGYDLDADGCLDDTDGDGVTDDIDAFPADATEWSDMDEDGTGDNSDAFPMDATEDSDSDGDEVGDNSDPCHGFPNDDTDGDAVCDSDDSCPTDATDTDDDDDGVCDVEDICVGSSNTDVDDDQVCDDLDECEGNDASGDYDVDGLCSDSDNCPADANLDQADADGDGIGDECDADDDGDGVDDITDNCTEDANSDQSDLDGDGEGDACDGDDDGDGVTDEDDVCPFYSDADQADTDGDGYGDACDGDDDADGVADEDDLCPGTALDVPFNSRGCSGEQFIELKCGTAADYSWRRSGKFTRCVVKKSKAAQRKGLITKRERQQIIRRTRLEIFFQRWRSFLSRWC